MKLSTREGMLVLLGTAAVLLSGCSGTDPLRAGPWNLDRVENVGGSALPTPRGFDLSFSPNGDVTASDGCNSCKGQWSVNANSKDRGTITLACTRKFCPEFEEAQHLLGSLRTWELAKDRIVFPAGVERVILRRAQPPDEDAAK